MNDKVIVLTIFNEGLVRMCNYLINEGWILVICPVKPPIPILEALKRECEMQHNGFTFLEYHPMDTKAVSAVRQILDPIKQNEKGEVIHIGIRVTIDVLYTTYSEDREIYKEFMSKGGLVV